MKCSCKRCGTEVSIFWWNFSVGCNEEGNFGRVFQLCDLCMIDFVKFMENPPRDFNSMYPEVSE